MELLVGRCWGSARATLGALGMGRVTVAEDSQQGDTAGTWRGQGGGC